MLKNFSTTSWEEINGSSFHFGYLRASYNELVSAFGDPEVIWDDKTDYTWRLKTAGIPFTIYDYRTSRPSGNKLTNWHIGTHSGKETKIVVKALADAGLNATVESFTF